MRSGVLTTQDGAKWLVWFEPITLAGNPSVRMVVHLDSEQQRDKFIAAAIIDTDILSEKTPERNGP